MDRDTRQLLGGAFGAMFLIVAGVLASVMIIEAASNAARFPVELAEIEQLRKDAADIEAGASEDVIGQVVVVNRRIASMKQAKQMLLYSWAIPDGWDKIEPIPVPKRKP